MKATDSMQALLERARAGAEEALEQIVRAIRDDVYNLAVRMLWLPEDAEDATQEILIRVVTHLGSFRGESSFRTWVYRIAANHLQTVRKSFAERQEMTFATFGAGLHEQVDEWFERSDRESPSATSGRADRALLLQEMRLGCTHAMLLCLPREQRIALILADIFQLSSEEAAEVLEVNAPALRKRASRAREALRGFLREHCGLVNPAAFCRCEYRVDGVIGRGIIDPDRPRFAGRGTALDPAVAAAVEEWDELGRVAALYRGAPRYPAPDHLVDSLRELLDSGRYRLLN